MRKILIASIVGAAVALGTAGGRAAAVPPKLDQTWSTEGGISIDNLIAVQKAQALRVILRQKIVINPGPPIPTTPPAAPGKPDLVDSSDTGLHSTDDITKDATPTIVGLCDLGTVVQLYADDSQVAQATCYQNQYATTPAMALADGVRQLAAVAVDRAGRTSVPSELLAVTIDTAKPDQPIIFRPEQYSITNKRWTTVGGSGEEKATVSVINNFAPMPCNERSEGTVVVQYGNWNCSSSFYTPLPDGVHDFQARQTDVAGNVSAYTDVRRITVDTVPPDTPSVPDLTATTDTGSSSTDNITDNTFPEFVGTCTTGDLIKLYSAGTYVNQAVCANGTYSIHPRWNLSHSRHYLSARAFDRAGNIAPSGELIVDIVRKAP